MCVCVCVCVCECNVDSFACIHLKVQQQSQNKTLRKYKESYLFTWMSCDQEHANTEIQSLSSQGSKVNL